VKADHEADGADGEGVDGTPALFLNGRSYGGPVAPKYLAAWRSTRRSR
jgi:protein-disulfide isomerase